MKPPRPTSQLIVKQSGLMVFDNSTVVLAFVVCGGLVLELLKVVPEIWNAIASVFSRLTG